MRESRDMNPPSRSSIPNIMICRITVPEFELPDHDSRASGVLDDNWASSDDCEWVAFPESRDFFRSLTRYLRYYGIPALN